MACLWQDNTMELWYSARDEYKSSLFACSTFRIGKIEVEEDPCHSRHSAVLYIPTCRVHTVVDVFAQC
jgi:hypothetical protein